MSSQPGPQKDLNGSAPDTHSTALLFIDVVSDFNFPGGDNLLAEGLQIAPNLALLRRRAREAGVPVIYVNDNFGRWRSNFQTLLEECLSKDSPSRAFVEQIVPSRDD